jgi:arylsulfatase A-like enzyme
MKNFPSLFFRFALLLLVGAAVDAWAQADASSSPVATSRHPNIVIILSDDVGYGDVGCYGATKVSTPNIDSLAAGGLRFTDGHCTASTCTPSRYSILTGQYSFRNKRAVILPGNAPLIIDPKGATLPAMLKTAGYATGFVGKWHLGLGDGEIDWNGTHISPGPDEIGFDYSFFLPATPDRVPCVYIENHQVVGLSSDDPLSVSYNYKIGNEPTGADHRELLRYPADAQHSGTIVDHISRIGYMKGGHSGWWVDENMAGQFLSKAQAFVAQNKDKPFFLYYAPNNIHVPRAPNGKFLHTSECGIRGDSIEELDSVIGGMMDTLKKLNLLDNTIVIFSSDNGPIFNDGYADGSVKEANGHKPAGPYRGGKYQIYEGGTRLPFIVSWPGKITPGVSPALVNQLDLFASLADLVGAPGAANSRPDSQDILPAFLGQSPTGRITMVEQSVGRLALREGSWKLILPGKEPKGPKDKKMEEGDTTQGPAAASGLQLYDLGSDVGERQNVADQHPDIVAKMTQEFKEIQNSETR